MSHVATNEGESDDLTTWLEKFDIDAEFVAKYVQELKDLGISKVTDFEYIESKDDLDAIFSAFKQTVRVMDKIKMVKAWKSLHPQAPGSNSSAQSIAMDSQEREALESLGKHARMVEKQLLQLEQTKKDDSKVLAQQQNAIREHAEKLKNAIDDRVSALTQTLHSQHKQLQQDIDAQYKIWKGITLQIHKTKQDCDKALKIADFEKLAERRSTIIKSVQGTVKEITDALQNVDFDVEKHKQVVADMTDMEGLHHAIRRAGNVYSRCFEIKVTGVTTFDSFLKEVPVVARSILGAALLAANPVDPIPQMPTSLEIAWQLTEQTKAAVFSKLCARANVKVGIESGLDSHRNDDEKSSADAAVHVEWLDDCNFATFNTSKFVIANSKTLLGMRKTNPDECILRMEISLLTKSGKIIQSTQHRFQYNNPVVFRGYVNWGQTLTMGRSEEDKAMNSVCSSKFAGSRAATYEELFGGRIKGLTSPDKSSSGYLILPSGDGDFWKGSEYNVGNRRFWRKGWKFSSFPWKKDAPDTTTAYKGKQGTIAVSPYEYFSNL